MVKDSQLTCPKCNPDLGYDRHFYGDGISKPFVVLDDDDGNRVWHTPDCEEVKKEFEKWEEI